MFEQFASLNSELTEEQKVSGGVVGILTGVALIGMLAVTAVSSAPLQILIALMAVVMMVVGTLLLGTSGREEQVV
jgi:hypothetical protein